MKEMFVVLGFGDVAEHDFADIFGIVFINEDYDIGHHQFS